MLYIFGITIFLLSMQSDTEQRPHKISFYVEKEKAQQVTKVLAEKLEKRGVIALIIVK